MRFIRYSFYAVLMPVLVVLALANRQSVTLGLLPEQLADFFPVSVELPLFVIIMLAALTGLMVGYVLEFFREHKVRREAAEKRREVAHLNQEVKALKKEAGKEDDDVLALINDAG